MVHARCGNACGLVLWPAECRKQVRSRESCVEVVWGAGVWGLGSGVTLSCSELAFAEGSTPGQMPVRPSSAEAEKSGRPASAAASAAASIL